MFQNTITGHHAQRPQVQIHNHGLNVTVRLHVYVTHGLNVVCGLN